MISGFHIIFLINMIGWHLCYLLLCCTRLDRFLLAKDGPRGFLQEGSTSSLPEGSWSIRDSTVRGIKPWSRSRCAGSGLICRCRIWNFRSVFCLHVAGLILHILESCSRDGALRSRELGAPILENCCCCCRSSFEGDGRIPRGTGSLERRGIPLGLVVFVC